MPDPDTMQQVHNAANQAAQQGDPKLWSVLSLILGGGIVKAVQRLRGDTIVKELQRQGEETRSTLTTVGSATHEKLHELSTAIAVLGERMNRSEHR